MKTAEQDIRTLRKTAKTWLACLTYYSARGKINLGKFGLRLQSLFKPFFMSEIIQKTLRDTVPDVVIIKKRIMSRLTPNKVSKRMLNYPKIPDAKTQVKEKPGSFTLGRLIITWAILTDQSPQDFIVKVYPNISRAYIKYRDSTDCQGLSDEEYNRYPQESTRFVSDIFRIFIKATPEEDLIRFMHTVIKALAIVIEMPGLEKEINKQLGQASRLITKDTAQKIESAFKASPNTKERINIPELKALVQREEAKLGWSNHSEKAVTKTLKSSLSPELQEAVEDNDEIVRSSIEEVSRRGLLNNLFDALNGKLRPRFVTSITRFLKSIVHVKSTWEFDTSPVTQEELAGIRKWLFRR